MSPEQIEVERKAFEAHYRDLHWSLKRFSWVPDDRTGLPGDRYVSSDTASAWSGWLARAEKAQRVREALERILKSFPTDTDMHAARWEQIEVDEACNAYDAARAALKD